MTYTETLNKYKEYRKLIRGSFTEFEYKGIWVPIEIALCKQIPREPKIIPAEKEGGLVMYLAEAICPRCGETLDPDIGDYCPCCGQAIEWRTDETD